MELARPGPADVAAAAPLSPGLASRKGRHPKPSSSIPDLLLRSSNPDIQSRCLGVSTPHTRLTRRGDGARVAARDTTTPALCPRCRNAKENFPALPACAAKGNQISPSAFSDVLCEGRNASGIVRRPGSAHMPSLGLCPPGSSGRKQPASMYRPSARQIPQPAFVLVDATHSSQCLRV